MRNLGWRSGLSEGPGEGPGTQRRKGPELGWGGFGYHGRSVPHSLSPPCTQATPFGHSSCRARPASTAQTHRARALPSFGRAAPPRGPRAAGLRRPRPRARRDRGPSERTPGGTGRSAQPPSLCPSEDHSSGLPSPRQGLLLCPGPRPSQGPRGPLQGGGWQTLPDPPPPPHSSGRPPLLSCAEPTPGPHPALVLRGHPA